MKDKEYHMTNFAFAPKTLLFPQKMDEFNFIPAHYCISKIFVLYLGDFEMDVIKW